MYFSGFESAQRAWDNMEPPSPDAFDQYEECSSEDDDGMICEFSGNVEVQVYGGVETWECPMCGNESEEYIS